MRKGICTLFVLVCLSGTALTGCLEELAESSTELGTVEQSVSWVPTDVIRSESTGAVELTRDGRTGDLAWYPGDSGDTGEVEYECDSIVGVGSWCSCQGENSSDCDLLFADCDEAGGLFFCGSDLGLDEDGCTCL